MNTPANRAEFWPAFFNCALTGPLLGGLPYNVFLIPIPFSYVIGGLPALIGSMLFALWLRAGPVPGPWHTAAFGGWFGAVGCTLAAMLLAIWGYAPLGDGNTWLDATTSSLVILLPHGILGGAAAAGLYVVRWRRRNRSTSTSRALAISALSKSATV